MRKKPTKEHWTDRHGFVLSAASAGLLAWARRRSGNHQVRPACANRDCDSGYECITRSVCQGDGNERRKETGTAARPALKVGGLCKLSRILPANTLEKPVRCVRWFRMPTVLTFQVRSARLDRVYGSKGSITITPKTLRSRRRGAVRKRGHRAARWSARTPTDRSNS